MYTVFSEACVFEVLVVKYCIVYFGQGQ